VIIEREYGMWAQRLIVAGATALLVAAGAGCSSSSGSAPRASRPPVVIPSDPAAAFVAAKAQLGTESARFGMDTGSDMMSYTGLVNAETRNWEIAGRDYVVRRVGADLYVRASGKTLENMFLLQARDRVAAGGWAHTRLPFGREYSVTFSDQFPWNLANSAVRARNISRTGDRSFTGESTVKGSQLTTKPKPDKDIRVDVNLDEQGRFARIDNNIATNPPVRTILTFSDFGVAADITAPPPQDVAEEENPAFLAGTLLQ
jgi:hypothetical protein